MKPWDKDLLKEAISIAKAARENGNHPFGALLADVDGKVLLRAENSGEIFNVGGGPDNVTTLAGLVNLLSSLIGKDPVLQKSPDEETGQMRYVTDIRKIERTLNWTPRISLLKGLKTIL